MKRLPGQITDNMKKDCGLKLAQQMFPDVRPLPWPPDQPIAEIHKNSEGKYFVHIFYVTCTNVIKGGLRLLWPDRDVYGCNAEDMTVALFDTPEEACSAYTSFCKRNERMVGNKVGDKYFRT